MTRSRIRFGVALFATLASAHLASCAPRKKATIVVRVETDIPSSDLLLVSYSFRYLRGEQPTGPREMRLMEPQQRFPGNIRIPRDYGADATEIEVEATNQRGVTARQRARVVFVDGEWRQITMFLAGQCFDPVVVQRCEMASTAATQFTCGSADTANPCVAVSRRESAPYVEPMAMSDAGDASTPPNPSPMSFPWAGARLSSGNVTIRWTPPAGATQGRVSICTNFDCASPMMTAMGSSSATVSLPVGRYVYRVEHLDASMAPVGAPTLRPIEITSASTAPATAVGTSMFMNPIDTLRDFAFGARRNSPNPTIEVNGLAGTVCPFVFRSNTDASFGRVVRNAGDFNGDGFSDLIILAQGPADPIAPAATLAIRVDFTSAMGTRAFRWQPVEFAVPDATIAQPAWSASGGGDVNGDGLGDFVIGSPNIGAAAGNVRVVFGNASPSASNVTSNSVVVPGDNPSFGGAVASGCDFDGDGYADFAVASVSVEPVSLGARPVQVFFGGPAQPYPSVVINPTDPTGMLSLQRFGSTLACGADLDGDGLGDLAIADAAAAAGGNRVGTVSVWSLRGRAPRSLGATVGPTTGATDYAAAVTMGHIPTSTDPATPVLIVGIPNGSTGAPSAGEVKVYRFQSGALALLHHYAHTFANARLGTSVAIAEVASFANRTVVLMGALGRCSHPMSGMTTVDGCVVGFEPTQNPAGGMVATSSTLLAWEPITGPGVGTSMAH